MKRKNGIYKYILNIVLLFSSLFVYSCNKVDIDYKYVDVFLFVGMFYTFIGLLGSLIVDISYGIIDPRIKVMGRKLS